MMSIKLEALHTYSIKCITHCLYCFVHPYSFTDSIRMNWHGWQAWLIFKSCSGIILRRKMFFFPHYCSLYWMIFIEHGDRSLGCRYLMKGHHLPCTLPMRSDLTLLNSISEVKLKCSLTSPSIWKNRHAWSKTGSKNKISGFEQWCWVSWQGILNAEASN